jgi:hypothetical protein
MQYFDVYEIKGKCGGRGNRKQRSKHTASSHTKNKLVTGVYTALKLVTNNRKNRKSNTANVAEILHLMEIS